MKEIMNVWNAIYVLECILSILNIWHDMVTHFEEKFG